MSKLERKIEKMERLLDALQREVSELRAERGAVHPNELLSKDAVVGKDYVAWRFGCSVRAVKNGEGDTRDVPRYSTRPRLQFIKSVVDAAFAKKRKVSVRERAAEEISKAHKKRLYSTVTVR